MKKININNFEEHLIYEKLDNGLEIFLLPMVEKKNFKVMLGTKFGGSDLAFKIDNKKFKVPSGVAHFLEHKLFESNDLNPFSYYSQSGTDVNAVTTSDYTAYYFIGNNNFYDNLKYLINWLNDFSITDEKVEKEKGIILEEAHMYLDNPNRVMYDKIYNNTLVNDYKKYKTIGTEEDIRNITKKDLDLCYKAFYNPNNMFLIAVGNFDPSKTIKLIKEEYKKFSYESLKVSKEKIKEPDTVQKDYEEITMNVETPRFTKLFKMNKNIFNSLHLDKYNLNFYLYMIMVLAFGRTSSFIEHCYMDELALNIDFGINDITSHYLFEIAAICKDVNKLSKEIDDYLKNIKIYEEDFERIKKTWIASEVKMIDSINNSLYNILDDLLDYGEYKNNSIKAIKNLKFNTCLEVLKKLKFNNQAMVVINPKN